MSDTGQVVAEIVDHDLCCGCGVCAAVCPTTNLSMAWQENGDLAPRLVGECPSGCRLCLRVCPFGPFSNSEARLGAARFAATADIKHDATAGYYLESFVGYSLHGGHRERGASGGMATWFLETLLGKQLVDAIVCVTAGSTDEHLFEYDIVSEIESLRGAAGSRYYPVDISNALSIINKGNRKLRYAVVGLPCVLKGLQLAMEALPQVRSSIRYTLGLTCGHLPNRFYTEYLASLAGVPRGIVVSPNYRCKEGTTRAGNYGFRAFSGSGGFDAGIPYSRVRSIWSNGYFQINACNYCDDVYGEVADASFMDAWLSEFEKDPRVHSLVIVRHSVLQMIIREAIVAGTIHMQSIALSRVHESQRANIASKKLLIGARLFAATARGKRVPEKRCIPDAELYEKRRREVETRISIQQESKRLWRTNGATSVSWFRWRLWLLSLPLVVGRVIARLRRVYEHPSLLRRLVGRS